VGKTYKDIKILEGDSENERERVRGNRRKKGKRTRKKAKDRKRGLKRGGRQTR
jgi:hypothetical protein